MSQTELSAGVHKFNFSCQLPHQLPTSFESKYGYIRYQIKVELERPWKFDFKFCFGFTVLKVLDLNYESPALRSPMKTELEKAFFFGLSGKSLFVSAEIPMSGFVAGQAVPVLIKINNESKIDVEETKVVLKRHITYNSQTPRLRFRERLEAVAEVKNVGVPAKSKGNIETSLVIPAIPPTNIASCKVIQFSYQIHIICIVGGLHRNQILRLPVTLGTIPLQNFNYQASAPVNWNHQPSTSNAEPQTFYPPANDQQPFYPNANSAASAPSHQDLRKFSCSFILFQYSYKFIHFLAPPSYHEAMNLSEKDGDNDEALTEDKPFSPMYPIFNFQAPPVQPMQQTNSQPPPSYGFAPPQYDEKRGF